MDETDFLADSDSADLAALDVYRWSSRAADETSRVPMFTASNPAATVTVTVLFSGQILRVELSAELSMTEAELGAEITIVATLAQMQARAGQHVIIASIMRRLGHDPAHTASLLERKLGLPSPSTVEAERRAIFANYSAGER